MALNDRISFFQATSEQSECALGPQAA